MTIDPKDETIALETFGLHVVSGGIDLGYELRLLATIDRLRASSQKSEGGEIER